MIYVFVLWSSGETTGREFNNHEKDAALLYAEIMSRESDTTLVKVIRGKVLAAWDKLADESNTPQTDKLPEAPEARS